MKNNLYKMFDSIITGQLAQRDSVVVKRKNISLLFLNLLWDEGFIRGYKVSNYSITIFLKYRNRTIPVMNSIRLISKPGRRLYYSIKQIWKFDSSKYFIIFSTNKGLKSLMECKKLKIGGEACIVIT